MAALENYMSDTLKHLGRLPEAILRLRFATLDERPSMSFAHRNR